MIKFRQKDFSGPGKIKKVAQVSENPAIKTAILLSGPALGIANLSLNTSRKKKDTELRKEQTQAIEDLAEAIASSSKTTSQLKKSSRKAEVAFRKKHPEDINTEDCIIIPNPVSKLAKKK